MRPPEWFVSLLRLNHPLLSVRWGSHVGKWIIGQRAYIAPSEIFYLRKRKARLETWVNQPASGEPAFTTAKNKRTLESVEEELASALAGERILFMPDRIDQTCYDLICKGEHAKYGGYARFVDEIERQEQAAENDRERVEENKRFALHSESYDQADFITRKKQAELHNGHRDLGYLLHGKKADAPLITLAEF